MSLFAPLKKDSQMPLHNTRIQQGKSHLNDALKAARSGNFKPALDLSCRQYKIGLTTTSRIWHMEICGSINRYMLWLEAAFQQYHQVGRIQGGYSECLQDSMTYWFMLEPKHASWPERFRQMSEFPEMADWAQEINQRLVEGRLQLDPLATIA